MKSCKTNTSSPPPGCRSDCFEGLLSRKNIEAQTGRPVITSGNAKSLMLNTAVVGMIEDVVTVDDADNAARKPSESEEVL